MGWESIHLYQFDIRVVRYGSFELFAANPDVALSGFAFHQNETVLYVYDMGDHWEHEVRIEAINDAAPKKIISGLHRRLWSLPAGRLRRCAGLS